MRITSGYVTDCCGAETITERECTTCHGHPHHEETDTFCQPCNGDGVVTLCGECKEPCEEESVRSFNEKADDAARERMAEERADYARENPCW